MKYLLSLAAAVALGILMGNAFFDYVFPDPSTSKPEEAKVVTEVPKNPSTTLDTTYFGNGITMWRNEKHRVVCFIYEAGVGNNSRAGISCLPAGQVVP